MLRFVAAIIGGYFVMMVLVILAFSLSLVAPDFAFQKDRDEVTTGWLIYALVASLLAAIAGGYVAAAIARRRSAAHSLAVLAIVLGLGAAAGNVLKERHESDRPVEGMSARERESRAVQPTWYAFTLPFVGAAGIILGGRCRRRAAPGIGHA